MSDTTIRISAKALGPELTARAKQTPKAMRAGIRLAAERARSLLASKTPVDTGAMKARWRVSQGGTVEVVNDTPYAGVIEGGARPHGVSVEGRHAIKLWFMRKLKLSEKEASIRTEAFCQRLMAHGWPGTFFVRNALPDITKMAATSVNHVLDAASRRPAGKP